MSPELTLNRIWGRSCRKMNSNLSISARGQLHLYSSSSQSTRTAWNLINRSLPARRPSSGYTNRPRAVSAASLDISRSAIAQLTQATTLHTLQQLSSPRVINRVSTLRPTGDRCLFIFRPFSYQSTPERGRCVAIDRVTHSTPQRNHEGMS